jgi:metallo-beta-lactamase superfamily protein
MQDPSGELMITGVVQREAWLQRAMPPAEQLGEDLWSLPVPIPDNPLRYVSVYAFGTGEGLVLIDAGWGAEESWRALRDGLESIGAGVADVRGVLVTHMHFDHVGLAGRVRQASGAWIAMHPADQAVFARSDYRSAERAVAVEAEFLRGLGASPAEAAAAVGTAGQWEKFTTIALPDRLLTDGELADVSGWKLRAVHTPGSTPWQLAGELTWSRPWDQYSGQMRIFAVTETAAHAHLLERRGLVTASRTRPPAYTARAA